MEIPYTYQLLQTNERLKISDKNSMLSFMWEDKVPRDPNHDA